ncbi:MAG: PDZ domain-containing protein [bacterium]
MFGIPPRYLIRGGMIFQELTLNYLEVWGQNWENRAPLRLRLFKQLDLTRTTNASRTKHPIHPTSERIVILSQVLPDVVNIGYQELRNMVVKKVNGKKVVNLESMVEALQNPKTDFHRIEFLPGSERVQIVLPVQELVSADERIMKNFQIPRLQSL